MKVGRTGLDHIRHRIAEYHPDGAECSDCSDLNLELDSAEKEMDETGSHVAELDRENLDTCCHYEEHGSY